MLLVFSKYLSDQNYKNQIIDFEDNYSSHPNYPSLFSVTDSLGFMGIENIAARVEKDQLNNLPPKFIAEVYLNAKKTFVLVNKLREEEFTALDENGKKHTFSKGKFKEIWTSTIVAIEANKNKENYVESSKVLIWIGLSLLPISIYPFLYSGFTWSEAVSRILIFIGLMLSFLIIREKFFRSFDSIVSKICSSRDQTGGCDTVLNSNVLPGNRIEFSDLPLIFFLTGFMSILINNSSWLAIGALSLLSIPVILLSVYLQIFKLKSYCILCISVSFIIVVNAIIYLNFSLTSNLSLSSSIILPVLLTGIIVGFGWILIKGLMKELKDVKSEKNNLLKFKKNFSLLSHLSEKVMNENELLELEGIRLGEANAPLVLRLFISPSCSYCHKAYSDALNLMEKYPRKISVNIYYNVNIENDNNPYLDVIKNTIKIYKDTSKNIKEALDDWHIKKIPIDKWVSKWAVQKKDEQELSLLLDKQYQWCKINDFNYTPVRILETSKIPIEYDIQEIGFFLTDIIKEKPNTFLEEKKYAIPN